VESYGWCRWADWEWFEQVDINQKWECNLKSRLLFHHFLALWWSKTNANA
jgi:hypothetical protein